MAHIRLPSTTPCMLAVLVVIAAISSSVQAARLQPSGAATAAVAAAAAVSPAPPVAVVGSSQGPDEFQAAMKMLQLQAAAHQQQLQLLHTEAMLVLVPGTQPMAHGRALLESTDAINTTITTAVATSTSTSKTTTISTSSTTSRKISVKISNLSADIWAVSYTGFKLGQACLSLLSALLKAGSSGTVNLDVQLLVDLSALAASFGSAFSDLMSKISKLNADAVAPMR